MTTSRTERFIVNLIIFFYKIPSYIGSIFINIIFFTVVWFLGTLLLIGYINLILAIVSILFPLIGPTLNKWFLITCAALTFIPTLCIALKEISEHKEEFKN